MTETPWLRDAAAKEIPVTNPDYIRAWTVTKNKFNGNIRNREWMLHPDMLADRLLAPIDMCVEGQLSTRSST